MDIGSLNTLDTIMCSMINLLEVQNLRTANPHKGKEETEVQAGDEGDMKQELGKGQGLTHPSLRDRHLYLLFPISCLPLTSIFFF